MEFKVPEFFRWQGENKLFHFEGISLATFNMIFSLAVLTMIMMWIFKKPISRSFNNKDKHLLFLTKKQLFRLIGSIILIFMLARIILIITIKYPTQWEVLPLHLCRFMLFLSALSLIFNKTHYVKYFGHIAIVGAMIALSRPDFDFENGLKPFRTGLDSYYFWDHITTHSFLLILTSFLYVVSSSKFKAKDLLYTMLFFLITTIIIFIINWISDVYAPTSWKTNYFYLGQDAYNTQKDVLGVLSKWPFNLFTWTTLGAGVAVVSILFWIWQDNFYLDKINSKWVFVKQKSTRWVEFKNSFPKIAKQN
ncbi:YwaF family protein [Mycoplasmopsis phocirhinis]|uniref:YwaF family protein n=1 Tax=Mycoplasmopsis phocirhinis TaxID=142650 RepID=UPI0013EE8E3E|nr:YwaF family protein [Mycoplasmopsis phocirhinis]